MELWCGRNMKSREERELMGKFLFLIFFQCDGKIGVLEYKAVI